MCQMRFIGITGSFFADRSEGEVPVLCICKGSHFLFAQLVPYLCASVSVGGLSAGVAISCGGNQSGYYNAA